MGLAGGLTATARSGDRLGVLGECIRDGGVGERGRLHLADCLLLLDDMSLVGSARSGASVADARARLPRCALRAVGAQPTHPRRQLPWHQMIIMATEWSKQKSFGLPASFGGATLNLRHGRQCRATDALTAGARRAAQMQISLHGTSCCWRR
jgi:hypothetical protein